MTYASSHIVYTLLSVRIIFIAHKANGIKSTNVLFEVSGLRSIMHKACLATDRSLTL